LGTYFSDNSSKKKHSLLVFTTPYHHNIRLKSVLKSKFSTYIPSILLLLQVFQLQLTAQHGNFYNSILKAIYLPITQRKKQHVCVRVLTYISRVVDAKLERQGAQQVSKGELQSLT